MSNDGSGRLSKAVIPEHEVGVRDFPVRSSFPVTIYLRNESGHVQVEQAVDDLGVLAGFRITERDDPVHGSWFRQMRASLSRAGRSPARESVLAASALRVQLNRLDGTGAAGADLLMTNVAPLLASLKDTEDAVVQVGALLIVKSGGTVLVRQLTAQQQLILDHSPDLFTAPDRILQALSPSAGADLLAGAAPLARGGLPGGGRLSASGELSGGGQLPAADRPSAGEAKVPQPPASVDRSYRRSPAQAFTDGLGGVFDIFGVIQRQHWSRPPAFEDMLAKDARELCRELGLIPDGGNGSKEGMNQ